MHVYCSKALSVVFHGLYREGSPRYTGGMRSCATGAVPEKIKGSSSMGVAATPLKPLPSCYRVKRRGTSYRVLDMHVKFAKQFTHYLILFQELESNKKGFEF